MNIFIPSKKQQTILLLLGVLFIGIFLRFFHIGEQSYWIDEGFTLMQARAIAEHGYPLLDSGFIEKKDILLPTLLAPLVYIFPLHTEWVYRVIPAIFGSLSILILFLIGFYLWNEKVGLVSAFFLSISYWHIAWSRQVRGYELLIFFSLLTILFLIFSYRSGKLRFFLLTSGSALLATLSKIFGIFLFPIIAIILLAKKKFMFLGISGILFSLFLFLFGYSFIENALSTTHPNYISRYFFEYLWNQFGLFLPAMLIGVLLALIVDIKNRWLHISFLVFFSTTFLLLGSSLYVYEKRYLLILTPFLFLYTAYFFIRVAFGFRYQKVAILLLFFLFFTIDSFSFHTLSLTPKSFYLLEYFTPQPDFRNAYTFLQTKKRENDTLVSPYPFMDILYTQSFGYALPISYTGREDESSVRNGKEYSSGAPSLDHTGNKRALERVEFLRQKGSVFFILDTLAQKRIRPDLLELLDREGFLIYNDSFLGLPNQNIKIFVIPQK